MTDSRKEQVERLFDEALQTPPEARPQFLAAACDTDTTLRAEVESLLEAHQQAGEFLEHPLGRAPSPPEIGDQPSAAVDEETALSGRRVGVWRLTKRLAAGGMGDVYLASRADGQYQQQVAIKLIRHGVDTSPTLRKHIIRRFREERQHLANLVHPNIAALIDGGTTEDGLPYLVMEYIQGQPITDYCADRKLPLREKLELFKSVCLAVHHAHSKFVAHRDLKPSNILVVQSEEEGSRPIPKLLDFGIAKLLREEPEPEAMPRTKLGLRPMTPEYASPEQVSGQEITAATDVYSLGVVLYELVAGRRPYEVTQYDAQRIICDEPHPRPSQVCRNLSKEIDAIVMMALEKDPTRRYPSAAALAEDISRFLDGRPIMARNPTLAYVFSRFLRRQAYRVATAVLLVLAIAVTAALVISQNRQAAMRAREDALLNKASRLYAFAGGLNSEGQNYAAELALRAAVEIEREYPVVNQPAHATKLSLLGKVLIEQNKLDDAEAVLTAALDIWGERLGPENIRMAETQRLLGRCLLRQGRASEAEELLAASYPILERQYGLPGLPVKETLADLIAVCEALQQPERAAHWREQLRQADTPPATLPPGQEETTATGGEAEPTDAAADIAGTDAKNDPPQGSAE